ncbi:MAG TPA: hydroxylamine reductase, partial [bacterium]|nr:hydroxylamine reductase [bacterium]
MAEKMFCRQCEQTAAGKACISVGVCGKNPEVSALMDMLIYTLQAIAIYGNKLREKGIAFPDTDRFIIEALFTTVTNVDFDPERMKEFISTASQHVDRVKKEFEKAYPGYDMSQLPEPAQWNIEQQRINNTNLKSGILNGMSEDIRSLKEILLYGMKGMAAYADHAWILGKTDQQVNSFFYKGLSAIAEKSISADRLINLIIEFGNV